MTSPERWLGRLDFTPDIAEQLGIYLGQMTAFELILNKYFATLARLRSKAETEAIFGRIMNVSTRLEIIEALAVLSHNAHWQPKLKELLKVARSINKRRNEYIHGTYRTTRETSEVELLTWITSEKRPSDRYVITADVIASDTHKIQAFIGATMSLFHPDKEFPLRDELPASP